MPEVQDTGGYFPLSAERAYYDLSWQVVASLYVDACLAGWKPICTEEEATDREILRFAERSSQLDFLSDPAEDIYGLDDGKAI